MSDFWVATPCKTAHAAADRRWPHRKHASDGYKGDPAHAARTSDHNPDARSKPPGVVRADDTTREGIHRPRYVAARLRHPATRYVISNRRIMHVDQGFAPRRYLGSDPHTGHVHTSIGHGAEKDSRGYPLLDATPDWSHPIEQGEKSSRVRDLQALLIGWGYSVKIDGVAGPGTVAKLKAFQKRRKLTADGVAGPRTAHSLVSK